MAVVEDKTSFVLYSSYEEQLGMLTDEQAGKWIKSLYVYHRTGEKQCDDPMVAMLLSFTGHQMDIDARKYAESVERRKASASKAGKISAEKRAMKKAADECEMQEYEAQEYQPNATNVNDCQRFQHVDVDDDDDVDVLNINKQQQQRQEDVVEPHWSIFGIVDGDSIYCYGKNRIPTTSKEFLKIRDFAESLFHRYHTKRATNQDVERVFEHVYRPAYNSNGEGYAVLDQARADLLEFAFSQASVQDQVKWSYIDTIMDKYSKNDITTAAQAQEYEYSRKRGEVA